MVCWAASYCLKLKKKIHNLETALKQSGLFSSDVLVLSSASCMISALICFWLNVMFLNCQTCCSCNKTSTSGFRKYLISPQSGIVPALCNDKLVVEQEICSMMQSGQHRPESQRNVFNILWNPCHKHLRLRAKGRPNQYCYTVPNKVLDKSLWSLTN